MKRSVIALGLVLTCLPLAACTDEGYGGGFAVGVAYPYDGYYDDYYGPIYDGYWGSDGFFYYRGSDHDRHYRQGDRSHFHRGGDMPQGNGFHEMHGSTQPSQGAHMPHFDGGRGGGSR